MKRFFDSSVLVPVFYADHPHHTASTEVFLEAGKEDYCALRTLGEVYATLTGLPLRPQHRWAGRYYDREADPRKARRDCAQRAGVCFRA